MATREEIIRRREAGQTFAEIARQMTMSYATVRNVWGHYQRTGRIDPSYERCARRAVRKKPVIYERAVELKRRHPGWGAGLIWVELAEEFAEADLPSARSIQRWFHRAGVASRRRAGPGVRDQVVRGKRAHEVWALDAKEDMTLADGSSASWLLISDEGSGAVLHEALFPRETLEHAGPAAGEGQHSGGL